MWHGVAHQCKKTCKKTDFLKSCTTYRWKIRQIITEKLYWKERFFVNFVFIKHHMRRPGLFKKTLKKMIEQKKNHRNGWAWRTIKKQESCNHCFSLNFSNTVFYNRFSSVLVGLLVLMTCHYFFLFFGAMKESFDDFDVRNLRTVFS